MNQLDFFAEQRERFAITSAPMIDKLLLQNQAVAVGVSGGKDSGAAAWATINHLDSIGHTGQRILIHSDLGRIEWADSMRICEQLARAINVDLITVRRPAGGMVERWLTRWDNNVKRYADLSCVKLILPWSTPSMRFCTSELKTAIICRELVRRFAGQDIISVCGIRRQESPKRAKKPVYSWQTQLQSNKYDTDGVDWNIIIDWLLEEVWAIHEMMGLPLHEAYTLYGSTRVSCMFCIMSSLADLIKSALCPGNQDVYRELVDLELDSTFCFQERQWLADIAPHLLTEYQQYRLIVAKQNAIRREQAEARIPDHLLYEEGWPKVMPTYAEAVMLAEVRQEVAQAVGFRIQCSRPENILARYEELMKLKETKAIQKAEVEQRRIEKALKKLEQCS